MKEKAESKETKLINPVRKCVTGIVITVILSAIVWTVMLIINIMATQDAENYVSYLKNIFNAAKEPVMDTRYDGIFGTAEEIALNIEEATTEYFGQCQRKADLTARACYNRVSEQGDAAIGKLGKGGIVKIENGKVLLGDGIRTGIRNFPEMGMNSGGMFDYTTPTMTGSRRDKLVYSRIKGSYYYVEIVDGRKMLDYINKYVDYAEELVSVELAYNVDLYLVCPDREKSKYFYNLEGDLVYHFLLGYGSNEILSTEDIGLPSSREELLALNGQLAAVDSDDAVSYQVREVPELDCILIILTSDWVSLEQAVEETVAGVFVILVLTITFIIWISSVYGEMFTGLITDKKKGKYAPGRIRLIALSYGIIGALLVFGASLFFRSLNSIYKEITKDQRTLEEIETTINNNAEHLEKRESARKALYLEYARRVAELIEKDPELNNKEDLRALDRIIGSEYIMLFDSEGRQIGTSSDYINMELAQEDPDHPVSSADFRRILKGVPGIVHSAFKDEVTGRKLEQYGVRMIDEKTGQYGVLLLAVEPEEIADQEESIDRILRNLTPTGKLSLLIDHTDTRVSNISSKDFVYIYQLASDCGFGDHMLRDNAADFTRIMGVKHLCVS